MIQRTRIVENYNPHGGPQKNVFVSGPQRKEAERYVGAPIQPVNIRERSKPGPTVVENNNVNVYRPKIKEDKDVARPQKVAPPKDKAVRSYEPVNDHPVITQPVFNPDLPVRTEPVKDRPIKTPPAMNPDQPVRNQPVKEQSPVRTPPVYDPNPPVRTHPVKEQPPVYDPNPPVRTQPVKEQPPVRTPPINNPNPPVRVQPVNPPLNNPPQKSPPPKKNPHDG